VQLQLHEGLPFVDVQVGYRRKVATIPHVLIDTGSSSSILSVDRVAALGIIPTPDDELRVIRGVGGTEAVFARMLDFLQVGEYQLNKLEIEIGGMDYGFDILGILGMDFLQQARATVDIDALELRIFC